MILADVPRTRETRNGPGGHGGGRRCAGAWTAEPEIGFVRHEQRHETYPEYGPENHEHAILGGRRVQHGGQAFARALKSFAKFETNSPGIAPSPA